MASLVWIGAIETVDDEDKKYIFFIICIDIILLLPRTLLSVIFQMTGMMRQYSYSLMSEASISFALVMIMLIGGIRDFRLLILGDCAARVCSLLVSAHFAPGIVRCKMPVWNDIVQAVHYIEIGVFLLLSNMIGLVIMAIVRLTVEQKWGIAVFSQISLSFSVANLVLFAVSAASVVLFPILKRMKQEQLPKLYMAFNTLLTNGLLGCMALYYPLSLLLTWWLPKYTESFMYLGIVAPMCLYETQLALLCNNYMKALRKEKMIFWVNAGAVLFIAGTACMTMWGKGSILLLLYAVLFQSMGKFLAFNYLLCAQWKQNNFWMVSDSIIATILFVFFNFYIQGVEGFAAFGICSIVIYLFNLKCIKNAIRYIRTV